MYQGLALDPQPRPRDDRFGQGAGALLDLPDAMREQGFADLDLCHFHLPQTDTAYLDPLRGRLDRAGVRLLTFLVDDGDIAAVDATSRARDVELTKRWIDVAAHLGARYVRVAAGLGTATPADPAIGHSAASLVALDTYARTLGLRVITETWRPLALPPDNLRAIIDATAGTVGHCADFNNYESYGESRKYAALRTVLPGATTVHAGAQFDTAGMLNEADFRRCMDLAREANFSGPYVLIFSGPGDEWAGLARLAELVRGSAA
jgi:sugar phosphate isomerase/epimerase